jgi:hypothetical protein
LLLGLREQIFEERVVIESHVQLHFLLCGGFLECGILTLLLKHKIIVIICVELQLLTFGKVLLHLR